MIKIKLTITITSDFHIGTGTGRGRTTDSIYLRNAKGAPYVPGSTIKGLARDQAIRLIESHDQFGPHPGMTGEETFSDSVFREIFGGGKSSDFAGDRVYFDDAILQSTTALSRTAALRTGRSSRDRISGRTKDDHLFFYEDAPAARFETTICSSENVSNKALLLLLFSLRRVESLGAQRRRGKGKCVFSLEVTEINTECPNQKQLLGLCLPFAATDDPDEPKFQKLATEVLSLSDDSPVETEPTGIPDDVADAHPPSDETDVKSDAAPTEQSISATSQDVTWIVLGYAKSALVFTYEQANNNIIATLDHVPGASVRGAVAWSYLKNGHTDSDPAFNAAIATEGVQFGPLYPLSSFGTGMAFPVPASIHTCKHFPGSYHFELEQHGFADRLNGTFFDRCTAAKSESECDGPLTVQNGYLDVKVDSLGSVDLQATQVGLQVIQRTAVDQKLQRGADGQLFGIETIPRGTMFGGYVRGPEHLLKALLGNWETNANDDWNSIRVGKVRTRGMGHLLICCIPATPGSHDGFPDLLSQNATGFQTDENFYLTLYSDLIAFDDWLRPLTALTASDLWRLIEEDGEPPFMIERGFASVHRVGGYIGRVGIPRTPDVAIRGGSTWKLKWTTDNQTQRQAAWKSMEQAQQKGIGIRRADGFGRFVLNHPLHIGANNELLSKASAASCHGFHSQPTPGPDNVRDAGIARDPWLKELVDPGGEIDKSNTKYHRLLHELSQQERPAILLHELLTKQKQSSRENKNDSLEQFVSRNAEGLGLDKNNLMQSIIGRLNDSKNFKVQLEKIAGGK